jgi:hypothetical protein
MERAAESEDSSGISENIHRLEQPFTDIELLEECLAEILTSLHVAPKDQKSKPILKHRALHRYLPRAQEKLLVAVLPIWQPYLSDRAQFRSLVEAAFGLKGSSDSPNDTLVATYAISSILTSPISDSNLSWLLSLTSIFTLDRVHHAIFHSATDLTDMTRLTLWESHIKLLFSLTDRIANTQSVTHFPKTERSVHHQVRVSALTMFSNFRQLCNAVSRLLLMLQPGM